MLAYHIEAMNPTSAVVIGVTLFVLFIVAGLLKAKLSRDEAAPGEVCAYQARRTILSSAERSFAGVLEKNLPNGVGLLMKVRLGDVFVTRKGLTPSRRTSAWNRINQKHVDFLLVRMDDFAPLAGVELDDKSHAEDDRKQRDAFVDQVFSGCNLPLLHVPAAATYNVAELRAKVAALSASPAATFPK